MAVKIYPKANNLQTDAFLSESSRHAIIQNDGFRASTNAVRSAINEIKAEIKPLVLCSKPSFTQAIKAARKVNRKTYTRRFLMRFIGSILILLAIAIVLSSCQYTPSPNVYKAESFSNSTAEMPENTANTGMTRNTHYKTPIVGIFHPHGDDEIPSNGDISENDEPEYELANNTTISEIKTADSLVSDIDALIANNEQSKARRLISNTILNKELTLAQENTLVHKLRIINSQLLKSTAADGDCKIVEIKKGQTLYAISKMNKINVDALVSLNNINPNKYFAGQKIMVYKEPFNIIVKKGKSFVYLWQNDHIVDRYDATVNEVRNGIYRLKAKKKGALGEMIYTGKVYLAPDSTDLSTSVSIKLRDKDYEILNMLLVTGAILQVQ
ncbi:MAG: LysM peptidoglycan-binding domain-containing protein [Planctomycetes bacterium]|nr:LysM peptidoglycan-binding domain-containing protein [Planctomycetota bacterium]